MAEDYLSINRRAWDARVDVHTTSAFYGMPDFLSGKSSLNDIEIKLLGDITGKSILHLQCHFGQDSLSLQRLGAQVTGVDFSQRAIEKANALNAELNLSARFIQSDIYQLDNERLGHFDLVFTSYGTVGWLPDMMRWADIISKHLKPGGQFLMVDFHPVLWMFDDDMCSIQYSYFNVDEIELIEGSYADPAADIQMKTISWNHSLSEIMSALIRHGLNIDGFEEFDYSPYNCFRNMSESTPGKYIIEQYGNKLPMVYAIVASK